MEFRLDRTIVAGAYQVWSRPLTDEEWAEVVAACGHTFADNYAQDEDPREFWRLRQLRRSKDGVVVKEYRSGSMPPSKLAEVAAASQLLSEATAF